MRKNHAPGLLLFNSNRRTNLMGLLIVLCLCCWVFMFYKSGAAKNGTAVTGAPFNNNRTCTNCHGGGNFGGSIVTSLLDGSNNAVSGYDPGKSYTFKITMNYSTGSPKYGFQTAVATAANTDINKWGTMPQNIHTTFLGGHTYAEHSTALTTNIITIPWTAPPANTGSVTFYTAGNLVNGNGSTSGDQPVNTLLTIKENIALPVRLLYFRGTVTNGKAVLSWATAQELNNKSFKLEKSVTGTNYNTLATFTSKGNATGGSSYTYTDTGFKNVAFYRLKQVDVNGNVTTYNTVKLASASPDDYSLSYYAYGGSSGVIFYNGGHQQKINVRCTNMQGKTYYSYDVTANEGNNLLPLPSNASKEVLIITVTTESGIKKSIKVGIVR